jgi:hypothetical protein
MSSVKQRSGRKIQLTPTTMISYDLPQESHVRIMVYDILGSEEGGLAPVQREGMDYEFDIVLDLDLNHNALTSKDRSVGIINFNQYG